MSTVRLENSIPGGSLTPPASKSAAHRAMICAFLAGGGSVNPITDSKDMQATAQAIEALKNGGEICDCIESGSTLRFLIPVAAALGKTVTFVGSGKLPQRPIGDYLRLLPEHGVTCESEGGLPLTISSKLTGGRFELAGDVSSQYITGLLLALPLLDTDSEIVLTTALQSKPYVDMTVDILHRYGVEIAETESGYLIKGNQTYAVQDFTVEGDWSQAAFFLAAGAIGGDVTVSGVDINSTQGDKEIVNVLKRFGADITVGDNAVRAKKSALCGIELDAANIPDMVPTVAVLAAFADGTTVIKGAQRLRYKESDRIESVVTNLKKMGVDVTETPDGMIISGGTVKGAALDGYNDHRIVMAFAVAALFADGTTTITDSESINKSYPSFFEDYNRLGGKADVISDR
ncbi:MAG: 3-phosphoshikimate 1-carboxyvinyltransferase [Eubacterium sp.]|nr:3-phosphoshikimate 1-carboxyvinyltransferase [Eubacterium sp.]